MPFNINTFKTEIADKGILKNNQFEVIIAQPKVMLNNNLNYLGSETYSRDVSDFMRFRIDQVRVPGINIITADVPRYGVGPTMKTAVNTQMNDINLSILSDGYGAIWQYWFNWFKSINEFAGTESSLATVSSRIPNYGNNYKDDYATILQIVVYDSFGNTVQRINFYNVFPTAMRELPLSWDNNNSLLRLSISLTYSDYTIVGSALENFIDPKTHKISAITTRTTF